MGSVSKFLKHQTKVLQSCVSTIVEGAKGMGGTSKPNQPELLFELYDMEACPYCRRVREALTELNLDYLVKPCPKGGSKFRAEVKAMGLEEKFPTFVDPNKQIVLQESSIIIDYLYKQYSDRVKPAHWQSLPKVSVRGAAASAASLFRGLKADRKRTNANVAEPLELYSFDASPYSRLVRERLCELELPFVLRNVAKERWQDAGPAVLRLKPGKYTPKPGGKRERIMREDMSGVMQVPYLIDANTGTKMFESARIIKYLNMTYKNR